MPQLMKFPKKNPFGELLIKLSNTANKSCIFLFFYTLFLSNSISSRSWNMLVGLRYSRSGPIPEHLLCG